MTVPPVPGPPSEASRLPLTNVFAKLPLPHFFRYVLLDIALVLTIYALLIPFLIWQAVIMEKTGYRKIDLLWLFVPIAGTVVCTRTQWRYCSRTNYWDDTTAAVLAPVPAAA